MFSLKKLFNYAMKHPFRVGLSVMVLYACCSSEIMSMLGNVLGMGRTMLQPSKEVQAAKDDQLMAPDMDDVSMFAESKVFTSQVAQKNGKLEDIIDSVHQ